MIKKILYALSVSLPLGLSAQINSSCNNIGFESLAGGTYTVIPGWQTSETNYAATNSTINGLCYNYQVMLNTTVNIVTTPYVIPPGYSTNWTTPTVIPNSPFSGNTILELNSFTTYNMNMNTGLVRAEQIFSVTPSNQFLQYAYFVSMNPSNHPCCQSDYFNIELRDCSNNLIPASTSSATPIWSGNQLCTGTGTIGMSSTTTGVVYTPFWFIKTFNLSQYSGTCVKIRLEAGSCSAGGHAPRIFFDGACSPAAFTANGVQNGNNTVICDNTTATLTSLPANSYTWAGPGITGNNQSIITSTPGIYTLSIGNIGNAPLTQTINLIFGTTPTVSVNSHTICAGQSATLNALGTGINTYLWNTGATSSSLVVSPTVSTTYSVVANSSTCPGTSTAEVAVTNCTGVYNDHIEKNALKIYPNPSNGSFTIQTNQESPVIIQDMSGRILKCVYLHEKNNNSVRITDLGSGVYFITDKFSTHKIIVLENK